MSGIFKPARSCRYGRKFANVLVLLSPKAPEKSIAFCLISDALLSKWASYASQCIRKRFKSTFFPALNLFCLGKNESTRASARSLLSRTS